MLFFPDYTNTIMIRTTILHNILFKVSNLVFFYLIDEVWPILAKFRNINDFGRQQCTNIRRKTICKLCNSQNEIDEPKGKIVLSLIKCSIKKTLQLKIVFVKVICLKLLWHDLNNTFKIYEVQLFFKKLIFE